MPELPEVEVVARGLDRALQGATVESVELRWAGAVARPAPEEFARRLTGRRIVRAWRRAKFVVLDLDDGQHLLVHLRMTGTLCVVASALPADPYERAVLHLDAGCDLRFTDVRKFGRLYLVDDLADVVGDLGPEPLGPEFTAQAFAAMLARRRSRIKPLLLNQRFLAGLGNIYVDEALYRARIHPLRRTDRLTDEDISRLHTAIQAVLAGAIERGGTTLGDERYRNAEGVRGGNQDFLLVYGRKGQTRARCGGMIERMVVGQRGTHLCPRCQQPEEEDEVREAERPA